MEATAAAAGVSKGGLLYHFASKEAMDAGLLARMETLAQQDLDEMSAAEEGLVAAFLRTSVMDGSPIDRALVAGSKLAQAGSTAAVDAVRRVRELWADALRPHTRDETAVQLVLLVSDGLYFNNALDLGAGAGPVPEGPAMDALIALVERATMA